MKKALCAAFLLIMLAQPALAAWTDEFSKDFDEFGLDVAVGNALAHEVKPDDILAFVVKNEKKFSTKMSLKALYCAGVDRDVVRETAGKLGVVTEEINMALEDSIKECGSKMALQDRDVDKVPNNGNLSGKAPDVPQAAPPAQPQPAADVPKLIETPRSSERKPENKPSPSNP
jgi:hypothetical protein